MDKKMLLELLATAYKARNFSYSPYSKFAVGCAILLKDEQIICGVNIENASFGATICAERSAMASVISLGKQAEIQAIAIATNVSPAASPCGICRQFLSEFLSPATPIILGNEAGEREAVITNMSELLPHAFSAKALK